MKARMTNMRTATGLRIYDLDPLASDLWAVAGLDGFDPAMIDPDDLPPGFRWITEHEWEIAVRNERRRERVR